MKKLLFILLALAALGLIISGCSSTTNSETETAIEDFGIYKATPEAPAFGDADIAELAAAGVEEPTSDPVALSPLVDSIETEVTPDIFSFRMIWGNLEADSGITELTDWSGKLTVSRGAIVATHTIRFEPGQDYILPRWDISGNVFPEELGWVSFTSIGVDGIACKLFFPPVATDSTTDSSAIADEPVTITYESGPYSATFTMDDLEDLDTIVTIGTGNSISFEAMRWEPEQHRFGSLAGRWTRDEEGNGIFYGRWVGGHGQIMGTIKGDWGFDVDGNRTFVGKYIDNNGQFEGFVKGTWRDNPGVNSNGHAKRNAGKFWGRIYNANREPIGQLKGHFKKGDVRKGGFFAGRWCVGCNSPDAYDDNGEF